MEPRERRPSIKGTAFQSAPDDLLRLLAEGRVSRDALEARLEAEDLAILEEKVRASSWYSIESYRRMVELLAELEAPEDRQGYWIRRGARAAERLAGSGIYQQLGLSTETLGSRVGRFAITLSQLLYNFGSWHYTLESGGRDRFTVEVRDAADFPEVSRFATQGFIEWAATRMGGRPMRVESQRPRPDLVIFRGRYA
jgi:hypothetical protein